MGAKQIEKPRGWLKLILGFVLAFVTLIIQAIASFASSDFLTSSAIAEVVGGIVALLFVLVLGGKFLIKPALPKMGLAWKLASAIFIADGVIVVLSIASIFIDGEPIEEGWAMRILLIAIMCIGIGMFEEGLFRGLIFHGLLGRMGTSRTGVFAAVIISSLIFGLMHVIPDGSITTYDASAIAQVLLKTMQTGLVGIVFCGIVLATRSLWPVITLHALNDFMLLIIESGLYEYEPTAEYVVEGPDAVSTIIVYAVLCIAYMPSVVFAWREISRTLKGTFDRDRGAFWKPKNPQPAYAVAPTAWQAAGQMPQTQQSWTQAPQGWVQAPQTQAPQGWAQPQAQAPQGWTQPPQTQPSAYPQASYPTGMTQAPQPQTSQAQAPQGWVQQQLQQGWPQPQAQTAQQPQGWTQPQNLYAPASHLSWEQPPFDSDYPVPPPAYLRSLGYNVTTKPDVPEPPTR